MVRFKPVINRLKDIVDHREFEKKFIEMINEFLEINAFSIYEALESNSSEILKITNEIEEIGRHAKEYLKGIDASDKYLKFTTVLGNELEIKYNNLSCEAHFKGQPTKSSLLYKKWEDIESINIDWEDFYVDGYEDYYSDSI